MKRPEIIAEIGVNYYDIASKEGLDLLDACRLMIRRAKEAGADTAKFQTYKAENLAAKESPAYWDLSEEPTTSQRELFSKYDKLTFKDYKQLAAICREEGIEFMSTPFDPDAARQIDQLVQRHKIASADITNRQLLQLIGGFSKPVLLSTGAATTDEIRTAMEILQSAGCTDITLLHCVLNYPTPPERANLWRIRALKEAFTEARIGYSDHTKFNAEILVNAWLLGAEVIEKHFTLDKSLPGNDHYHAADDKELKLLCTEISRVRSIIGDEQERFFDENEQIARSNARRGVYLHRLVKAGKTLAPDDVTFLRPQLDGITPVEFYQFVENGTTYRYDLDQEHLLKEGDLAGS